MPYLKPAQREAINAMGLDTLVGYLTTYESDESVSGVLNYIIFRLVKSYLTKKGVSYLRLAALISGIECSKLEIYRRLAAGYEDEKIKQNGDV